MIMNGNRENAQTFLNKNKVTKKLIFTIYVGRWKINILHF